MVEPARTAMTKADLIGIVAKRLDITQVQAGIIVEAALRSIVSALQNGQEVEIRGFGSFRFRNRAPRKGRNPKTGEKVDVPPKKIPYFKMGKELKALAQQRGGRRGPGSGSRRSVVSQREALRLDGRVRESAPSPAHPALCRAVPLRLRRGARVRLPDGHQPRRRPRQRRRRSRPSSARRSRSSCASRGSRWRCACPGSCAGRARPSAAATSSASASTAWAARSRRPWTRWSRASCAAPRPSSEPGWPATSGVKSCLDRGRRTRAGWRSRTTSSSTASSRCPGTTTRTTSSWRWCAAAATSSCARRRPSASATPSG